VIKKLIETIPAHDSGTTAARLEKVLK